MLHAGPGPAPARAERSRGEPALPNLEGTRYRALRRIGEGGMGVVYEAEHIDLGRRFALKILAAGLTEDVAAVHSFRQEARTASQLGADQIVEVSDFAELPDGRLMYSMELLDGPTLREAVDAEAPLPVERVIGILRQLCQGLAAAHDAGVIHRDIKPDNVVLARGSADRPDAVKILDFGVSTIDGAQPGSSVMAGTPAYIAPELILGHDFDHRVDQYAVGCTAYELLTGHPPFDVDPSTPTEEVLRSHTTTVPLPLGPAHGRRSVPRALQAVVLRCLAKAPDDRYADMKALEAALCEAQVQARLHTAWDDLPLPDGVSATVRARLGGEASATRWGGRGRVALAGVAAAVLLAVGWTGFSLRPDVAAVAPVAAQPTLVATGGVATPQAPTEPATVVEPIIVPVPVYTERPPVAVEVAEAAATTGVPVVEVESTASPPPRRRRRAVAKSRPQPPRIPPQGPAAKPPATPAEAVTSPGSPRAPAAEEPSIFLEPHRDRKPKPRTGPFL